MRNLTWFLGGALVVGAVTLLIYRSILFPPGNIELYPWASDTLGHVFKAEYLAQQFSEGIFYPNLLPQWYMGLQVMRYHPPLPYYLLVALGLALRDPVTAANWFIGLCAYMGGLSWLLYRRWVGWLPALVGGVLFTFLPDNVRVAMAEGNLPRVLATAILPLTFYFLMRSLESSGTAWHLTGLALCFAAIVLSHAMMAAIYAMCAGILTGLFGLARLASIRRATFAVLTIALGMLLSGFWLLPSFTGGITELDSSAMTEALAVIPLTDYLNPRIRTGDPEALYTGAILITLAVAALVFHKRVGSYPVALTATGVFGILITTPGINQLFNTLPLHSLLWPLRFLGAASFLLLLAVMWAARACGKVSPALTLGLAVLLAIDGGGSLFLINLRPVHPDVAAISRELAASTGWREATLDQSRLGSATSYFFSAKGGREQVFGWAYQGARTARTVAALNEALEMGVDAYLLDRLDHYGVDDLALLEDQNASRLEDALQKAGFQETYAGEVASLFHRDGRPRACLASWPALGIGRGAQNLAYLFPQIILGSSTRVDDYSSYDLSKYKTIVLSGFDWRDKVAAEGLIRRMAVNGTRVVVDLTGSPVDALARIPHFLDVWGEPVILSRSPIQIQSEEKSKLLQPFVEPDALWYTHMLQGLQTEVWSFDYLGVRSILAGYNTYGQGDVWFVGLNLPYHAASTQDAAAIELLSSLLALPASVRSECRSIELEDYQANPDGYRFGYQMAAEGDLFVPVAYLEGIQVHVDEKPVEVHSYEQLVSFTAPAGEHFVEIRIRPTRIYTLGWIASALAACMLCGLFVFERGRRR